MKSLLSFVGWLCFLLAVAGGLLFYNLRYVPAVNSVSRQRAEMGMWMGLIDSLEQELERREAEPEAPFLAVFTFDELFGRAESFELTEQGQSVLQGCIPKLQESAGTIEVTAHTDSSPVPEVFESAFASNWEYAAAKAGAVVRALEDWGIASERMVLKSAGATKPRADNSTVAGRTRNQRIEILTRR